MGKVEAHLPGDLLYASNHKWCRADGSQCRFGFTSYAIVLMKDVYFLDWHVSAGDPIEYLQEIGHIETSKAVSDLYAPLQGTLLRFNGELLNDPSGINVDGYGEGWLYDLEADPSSLMNVDEYHQLLEDGWEKTQQMIKGKMNLEE